MDGFVDESGNVQDGPALKRVGTVGSKLHYGRQSGDGREDAQGERPARVPQGESARVDGLGHRSHAKARSRVGRLPWCRQGAIKRPAARRGALGRTARLLHRKGQAQRWWHNENLEKGLLPFTSEALAASVGKTVEVDAAPPTWEACDVVFDALSRSQSGIIDKSVIDERRAAYEEDDGSFNVAAFESDLSAAKVNIGVSYAIFPGSLNLIFLVAFLEAGGVDAVLDAWNNLGGQVDRNVAIWTGMASGQGPM